MKQDYSLFLFCCENKTMENLPPTTDALLQHARQAAYQASVWITSDISTYTRVLGLDTWDECDKKNGHLSVSQ